MPKRNFYEGLSLSERLQKFADHHASQRNRHISNYEAELLAEAIARIDQTIAVAIDAARADQEQAWRTVAQRYESIVHVDGLSVEVLSIPAWQISDALEFRAEFGLAEISREPQPTELSAAVAALLNSSNEPEFMATYQWFLAHPTTIEDILDEDYLAIVNRLLYQRSIAIEQSPPIFEALVVAASKADAGALPGVVLLVAVVAGWPVLVILGTVIGAIILQVIRPIV